MTEDERFKQKVAAASGDPNFDYSRYGISLSPVVMSDSVGQGTLTVAVSDPDKVHAEQLVKLFASVFTTEYTAQDGLFRQRFIESKQQASDAAEQQYQDAAAALRPLVEAKGLPFDEMVRTDPSLIGGLNTQEADLEAQRAEVAATLAGSPTGVAASGLLGHPVSDGDARAALEAQQKVLDAALASVRARRLALSDVSLDAGLAGQIDNVRALGRTRNESLLRLNNANGVVSSAETDITTSYPVSKGVGDTLQGRIALVLVVTLIAGLGAIFGIEWLSQPAPDVSSPVPGR
jgi:hypothetical protein